MLRGIDCVYAFTRFDLSSPCDYRCAIIDELSQITHDYNFYLTFEDDA